MALLTSRPISELAIELLRRQLTLVATVSRIPAGDYYGGSGGTVTVPVPTPRAARQQTRRGDSIVYDDAAETPVDVTISHWYSGALVDDEQLSLDIRAFGRQIVLPQVESVARAAEDEIAAVMNALDADPTIAWAASEDAPDADRATVLAIREQLTLNETPAGDRWVACAPDITTRLLAVPGFIEADKRGASSALESAEVGQVYGLRFIESAALDAGTCVAYHRSGFCFGSVRPVNPSGGADSTTVTDSGISLRVVRAFDAGRLSEACVTSVFAGAAVVPEDDRGTIKRALRIETAGS